MINPTYSVCITHFNNVLTLRESLQSVLSQLDDKFEVVVVDQSSNDGSIEVLEEFEARGQIKLYHQTQRNRGLGRQLAFERSMGKYVISNMDMDDIFGPELIGVLLTYHTQFEEKLLRVRAAGMEIGAITIATRELIERLGGWNDLRYFEDVDLWNRARKAGVYREMKSSIYSRLNQHETRGVVPRIRYAYVANRERIRMGVFPRRKFVSLLFPLYAVSWVGAKLKGSIAK
jgi:glycosyltransferase involved in cell wall biosynthesis